MKVSWLAKTPFFLPLQQRPGPPGEWKQLLPRELRYETSQHKLPPPDRTSVIPSKHLSFVAEVMSNVSKIRSYPFRSTHAHSVRNRSADHRPSPGVRGRMHLLVLIIVLFVPFSSALTKNATRDLSILFPSHHPHQSSRSCRRFFCKHMPCQGCTIFVVSGGRHGSTKVSQSEKIEDLLWREGNCCCVRWYGFVKGTDGWSCRQWCGEKAAIQGAVCVSSQSSPASIIDTAQQLEAASPFTPGATARPATC